MKERGEGEGMKREDGRKRERGKEEGTEREGKGLERLEGLGKE